MIDKGLRLCPGAPYGYTCQEGRQSERSEKEAISEESIGEEHFTLENVPHYKNQPIPHVLASTLHGHRERLED